MLFHDDADGRELTMLDRDAREELKSTGRLDREDPARRQRKSTGGPFQKKENERGQALVEFAFVGLAFLLFIFAIIESGRLFESWITVQHASREAARWGVTGQDTCPEAAGDRLVCIQARAAEALGTLKDSGTAQITVGNYEFPDYLDPASLNDPGGACDLLEVHIDYDHQVVVPLINAITGSTITLSTDQRMVNEPFGAC